MFKIYETELAGRKLTIETGKFAMQANGSVVVRYGETTVMTNVTAAKEAGVGTITPVVPKAEVKPAAKQAIEDTYTAKVAEIEKRPELTTEEKEAAKAEAT